MKNGRRKKESKQDKIQYPDYMVAFLDSSRSYLLAFFYSYLLSAACLSRDALVVYIEDAEW
jgi:hypothetical protein